MKHQASLQTTLRRGWRNYRLLLNSVPSLIMALFVVSVVLMNLLANKEIKTGLSWLALDCGFVVSWLSFLSMDMLTKRFGPKAAIQLSLTATGVNLLICAILALVSHIGGNWAASYDFASPDVNAALDSTIGGTWYVVVGSTIAFSVASVVNAIINAAVGKVAKKNNFVTYALRSYVSTLIGQFVDNFIFALLVSHVYFGWSLLQCVMCSVTGCVVELLSEVVFSPLGYRACKIWERDKVGHEYISRMKNPNRYVDVLGG